MRSNRSWSWFITALVLSAVCVAARRPRITKWKVIGKLPGGGVTEAGGTVLGTKKAGYWYVVFGGFRFPRARRNVWGLRLWPGKKKWRRLTSMPRPLTHVGQATDGRFFYAAGGFLGDHPGKSVSDVYRYDIEENRWKRLPNLPAPRAGGGLLLVARRWLIFSGGVNRPRRSLRKHVDHGDTWSLDLVHYRRGWRKDKAPIPYPRNHMAAVTTCNRYLWIGGQKKNDEWRQNSRVVSEYIPWKRTWAKDPWKSRWSPAWLPQAFGHISASVLPLWCGALVVGGTGWNRSHRNQLIWWHPARNRWVWVGKYPYPVATPVCGKLGNRLVCGTGETRYSQRIYMARIL